MILYNIKEILSNINTSFIHYKFKWLSENSAQ